MSTKAEKITAPNPFAAIGEALESAAERFEESTSTARESAKKAAGSARKAVKVGAYNTAYGVSYGVVFASVFLTELLPADSTIRRGLEEGADAALEAASKPETSSAKVTPSTTKPKKAKKVTRKKS